MAIVGAHANAAALAVRVGFGEQVVDAHTFVKLGAAVAGTAHKRHRAVRRANDRIFGKPYATEKIVGLGERKALGDFFGGHLFCGDAEVAGHASGPAKLFPTVRGRRH